MVQFERAVHPLFQELPELLRFQKIFEAPRQIRIFYRTVRATPWAEAGLNLVTFDLIFHIREKPLSTGLYVFQGYFS